MPKTNKQELPFYAIRTRPTADRIRKDYEGR
jgi:hypothetical protein